MRGVSQLSHRDRLTALVNGWHLTGAPREARRQCSTRGLTEMTRSTPTYELAKSSSEVWEKRDPFGIGGEG
eukprot:1096146-Prorocentrum_minimum.AAC.1